MSGVKLYTVGAGLDRAPGRPAKGVDRFRYLLLPIRESVTSPRSVAIDSKVADCTKRFLISTSPRFRGSNSMDMACLPIPDAVRSYEDIVTYYSIFCQQPEASQGLTRIDFWEKCTKM
jgi:hypothetical protein